MNAAMPFQKKQAPFFPSQIFGRKTKGMNIAIFLGKFIQGKPQKLSDGIDLFG